MQLPAIQGTFDQPDFFVYAACDSEYFDEFAVAFVGSLRRHTNHNIHLHLFNPNAEQITWCQRHGVGITWEHMHLPAFAQAAMRWQNTPAREPALSQWQRTATAMGKGGDVSVADRLRKTYYACARFIRLAELYPGQGVLALDIDAVVRQNWPALSTQHDLYIHHITGRRARYLAGGLWLSAGQAGNSFLNTYSQRLQQYFVDDYVYWGLDQDLLDGIVPGYNHAQLPISYIDWNMSPASYIWTAKGTRKNLAVFVNEQSKYAV
jgi:hypothetical protein